MRKITAKYPETRSADVVAENLEHLKTLFPEAFTESKIDFEILKQLLGAALDEREEKYGLNWHGKRQARQLALTPSTGTLRPCPAESVDWDTTQNLMIEGDNLEVLKLLQKSYAGKVKLIYIDPPYNTGKDFIYPDNYRDNIANYLELTGQVDSENRKLSSNTEASGRFHTDWLNMMYPRLKLARNLLCDDGMIAVSVDDTEVGNLRQILNEVFGEEQFQAQVVVQSNKRGQTYKQIAKTHEFLIIYSRSENLNLNELDKDFDALPFKDSIGAFDLWELRNRNPKFSKFNRPNLFFPIYVFPGSIDECGYPRIALAPEGNESVKVLPRNSEGEDGCWRWSKDKISMYDLKGSSPVLVAKKRRDGEYNIYQKSRKSTTRVKSIWFETKFINEQGTVELGHVGMGDVFDHPKPVALVQQCLYLGTETDDIVMDFFAGSGTTGNAVFAQNASDDGKRRFIVVQFPERLDVKSTHHMAATKFLGNLSRPRNITELTKERLRRAAAKIKDENPMFAGDLGFRVYKLDTSNIRPWEPDRDNVEGSLLANVEHIKPDRSEDDILYEMLLKLGLDLCVPIERRSVEGKSVHSIGVGTLMACLDEKIDAKDVEPLANGIAEWCVDLDPAGDTTVVFRDAAFADDVAKTNLTAILEQRGLKNVRSL